VFRRPATPVRRPSREKYAEKTVRRVKTASPTFNKTAEQRVDKTRRAAFNKTAEQRVETTRAAFNKTAEQRVDKTTRRPPSTRHRIIQSTRQRAQPSTRKQAPRSGRSAISHQQDSRTDSQ
jgi:hypothetical protein